MANIRLKRSSVASKVPLVGDLDLGEMAINTNDGKVFIKKDDGTASIVEVGGNSFEQPVRYISSSISAVSNDIIVCDSAGAALGTGVTAYTITLPSGTDGDIIRIMDGSGNSENRSILVSRNGNNIDGSADDLTLDVNYFDIKLVFQSGNWSLGGK